MEESHTQKTIEYYYKKNSYIKLLQSTKKYKEIYNSIEALIATVLSLLTVVSFYYIYNNSDIGAFNEMIKGILISVPIGLIGTLGFIVSGLAIISGTIGSKLVDQLINDKKIEALIGILFSFYFIGSIIGIAIVAYMFMYVFSFSGLIVTLERLVVITLFLSYLFWFVISYLIGLLGTCLRMFLVNYKFSKESELTEQQEIVDIN